MVLDFVHLQWHLWEGTWKINFLLKGPFHVGGGGRVAQSFRVKGSVKWGWGGGKILMSEVSLLTEPIGLNQKPCDEWGGNSENSGVRGIPSVK